MIIMHTANRDEYESEIKTGSYGSLSLERCGFIHCSDLDTYYLVAPNFKDDYAEKVILLIDTDKLNCEVKWEDGGGLDFPHIYGLLNREAIVGVYEHLWSDKREWIPNEELKKYAVNGFKRQTMDKIPFWEETYRNRDINTFPAEPNGTILEFEHFLRKDSVILEAGCGEGQNVRYLAKNGYSDIDAFDLSEAGISKLHWICEREGLRINAFTDDLAKFQFAKSYDLVMTFATLCFVEKDKWRHFIEDAKEHTKPNGLHIIHTFTNTVPASPDIAPFAVGLADEGEIKDLYSDWEVLQFRTYVFDDEHPGVPKHQHAVNKLVARKIGS